MPCCLNNLQNVSWWIGELLKKGFLSTERTPGDGEILFSRSVTTYGVSWDLITDSVDLDFAIGKLEPLP
jgi:hypothetical protein